MRKLFYYGCEIFEPFNDEKLVYMNKVVLASKCSFKAWLIRKYNKHICNFTKTVINIYFNHISKYAKKSYNSNSFKTI